MSCEFSALGLPKKTQRPVCNLYVFLKRILSFISSKASTPPLGFRLPCWDRLSVFGYVPDWASGRSKFAAIRIAGQMETEDFSRAYPTGHKANNQLSACRLAKSQMGATLNKKNQTTFPLASISVYFSNNLRRWTHEKKNTHTADFLCSLTNSLKMRTIIFRLYLSTHLFIWNFIYLHR